MTVGDVGGGSDLGEVVDPGEHFQAGAHPDGVGYVGALDRSDLILRIPDQQRRQLRADVELVECTDRLSVAIDQRAQRA